MTRRVSRPTIIGALLRKELVAYSRDLVYLALTLVLLVVIPLLFRFLPDSVDETITLAVSPSLTTLVADARADLEAGGATPDQLAMLDELDLTSEAASPSSRSPTPTSSPASSRDVWRRGGRMRARRSSGTLPQSRSRRRRNR